MPQLVGAEALRFMAAALMGAHDLPHEASMDDAGQIAINFTGPQVVPDPVGPPEPPVSPARAARLEQLPPPPASPPGFRSPFEGTIGASRPGERYIAPTFAEIMAADPHALTALAKKFLFGDERPRSVAAQDPYGITAWERGAGPAPALMMGSTAEVPAAVADAELFSRAGRSGLVNAAGQPFGETIGAKVLTPSGTPYDTLGALAKNYPGFLDTMKARLGFAARPDLPRVVPEEEIRHVLLPGELREGHLRFAPAAFNEQNHLVISTRVPTDTPQWRGGVPYAYSEGAAPLTTDLSVVLKDPTLTSKMAAKVRTYELLTPAEARQGDREVLETFVEKMKDNLLWLWDQTPGETRELSKRWYEGGHVRTLEDAGRLRVKPEQVAVSIAALSPKKDWFENAELARRLGESWRELTDTNAPFTEDLFDRYLHNAVTAVKRKTGLTPAEKTAAMRRVATNINSERAALVGKRFEALSATERAAMIRAFGEGAYSSDFRMIMPTGEYGPTVMTGGTAKAPPRPWFLGWGLTNEMMAKAIMALEDGRPANLSAMTGIEHKVRSFYNNLIAPHYPGAVTIDTHAVAAGHLLPLGLSQKEVEYVMGGVGNKALGISGANPLYAEAYNRAAAARGVLPREMQSVTWEAVRGLFTPAQRGDEAFVARMRTIWDNYRHGSISLDTARSTILREATADAKVPGQIRPPEWAAHVKGTAPD